MKKIILLLVFVVSATFIFAQTCTLRLEMPATPPNVGDDFFVEIWMDVLDYPGYPLNGGVPTLKSGQMGVNFDAAVLTPIKTGGPVPLQKYAWNINQMFADYSAKPAEGYPNPGDLRFVSYTTSAPGMDPSFYGGIPMHMWDLKFHYNGGTIALTWQDANKMIPAGPNIAGGTKSKIVSYWTAWDDAAYAMTYVNIPNGNPAITWTGAVDNDWANTGNWDSGTVPTATDDVVIPVTANDPMLSAFGECNDMQIDAGATVTVGSVGGALTTHGMLTNDGMLYVDGTASGDISGSFIDMGGMAGSGTFEMDQDVAGLTAPAADPTGWHYISAPVNGFTSDDMWDYFLNTWDETNDTWVQHTGNPSIPCDPAPTMAMNAMDAWSVKYDVEWPGVNNCPGGTGPVAEFMSDMANVHTGPYSAPATVNGTFEGGGWNFFGNPYPSSIDPALITWDPNMNQSTYYWDGFANTYVSWAGGVGSVIPPTQGFFSQSTAAGTMAFTGAERIHGGDWFWKSEINNLLQLQVNSEANDYHDNVYVRFMNDATAGFDKVWDAKKLMSYVPGVPQIYTTNGSNKLSIDARQETETVPMNFESVESGTFTISAVEATDMTTVILEDTFTNEFTDLMTSSYTFDHTAGAPANRFIIHFAPLGVNELNADNVNIWSSENNIYVKVPSSINGDIVVYNLMGQEVVRTDIAPGLNTIPMDHVNANYVVKVLTDDNAVTGKVYIK